MSDTCQPVEFKRPRFVVGKIFFGLLLAYFAITIAAGFWWRQHARSMLKEQTDAIHARGEPVTLAEATFFKKLPPRQNAFTLYDQAIEAFDGVPILVHGEPDVPNSHAVPRGFVPQPRNVASESLDVLLTYPIFRREHADESAEFLEACRPALALVRQARGMDGAPIPNPSWTETLMPSLAPYRKLAKLCSLAAAMAHDAGDDREALEHLRDLVQLRDLLDGHPSLITALVQAAITAQIAASVEQIAPTLRIGDGPGEVPAENVRELAMQLVQSDVMIVAGNKGLICERIMEYEMLNGLSQDAELAYWSHIVAKIRNNEAIGETWININAALLLRYHAVTLGRIGDRYSPNNPDATPEDIAWARQLQSKSAGFGESLAKCGVYVLLPSLEKFQIMMFRSLASQRMAGLAMLMRVYEVENGRPIDTLDDLAPRYLAALPEDPFSPFGEPPRYLPDELAPLLYSVHDNQRDDGGNIDALKGGRGETKDWPFFLNNSRDQALGRPEQPPEPKR